MTRTPRLTSLGAFAAESIDVGIGGDVTRESTADESGGDAADCELAGFAEVIAVVGSEPRPRTPRLTSLVAFAAESIDVGIGDAADCELAGFAEVIAVVGSEPRPRTPRLTVAFAFAEPFGNAGGRSYGCLSRRTPCGAD